MGFDKNNRLACIAGKFAEPCIWYDWMKANFFVPQGYQLVGDTDIIGEEDPSVFDQGVLDEYHEWKQRISEMLEKRAREGEVDE